jgi:hypothetical protein
VNRESNIDYLAATCINHVFSVAQFLFSHNFLLASRLRRLDGASAWAVGVVDLQATGARPSYVAEDPRTKSSARHNMQWRVV